MTATFAIREIARIPLVIVIDIAAPCTCPIIGDTRQTDGALACRTGNPTAPSRRRLRAQVANSPHPSVSKSGLYFK
jgi:hypothetical protein